MQTYRMLLRVKKCHSMLSFLSLFLETIHVPTTASNFLQRRPENCKTFLRFLSQFSQFFFFNVWTFSELFPAKWWNIHAREAIYSSLQSVVKWSGAGSSGALYNYVISSLFFLLNNKATRTQTSTSSWTTGTHGQTYSLSDFYNKLAPAVLWRVFYWGSLLLSSAIIQRRSGACTCWHTLNQCLDAKAWRL